MNDRSEKITTTNTAGFSVGDDVFISFGGHQSIMRQAARLLIRPRIHYVAAIDSDTTLTLSARRMSWGEWRDCWAQIRVARWWRRGGTNRIRLWHSMARLARSKTSK